jgi:hypothetical protein
MYQCAMGIDFECDSTIVQLDVRIVPSVGQYYSAMYDIPFVVQVLFCCLLFVFVLCLMYSMLSVFLDYQFLIIHSVCSN